MTLHFRPWRSLLKTTDTKPGKGSRVASLLQRQSKSSAGPLAAYVGTFGSGPLAEQATQSNLPCGIQVFHADRTSGELSSAGVFEMSTSPSFLVTNKHGTRLYSANETDSLGSSGTGSVSAFAIGRAYGELSLLNTVSSGGTGPTHVSIHPTGRFLFVANYSNGSVAVINIMPDGSLGEILDLKYNEVTRVNGDSNTIASADFESNETCRSHAHMIQADSTGRVVIHVDLGSDKLFTWKFDEQTGLLTPNDPPFVSLPSGVSPRHFCFHPNGHWLYSIQEEASSVTLFEYCTQTGALAIRQTNSTLPSEYVGSNYCSSILVSADGRFLYAGNRLYDSIAIFAIGQRGELTRIGEEWARGNYPRSFNFDPTGKFLYCCNQRSNNISLFYVDRNSGNLSFSGHYTAVENPAAIEFLDLCED